MATVTAGTVVTPRPQLAATALGVIAENFPVTLCANLTAPVSQTVYGCVVGCRAGDVITGIKLRNNVAAAGTLPFTARFGLADATGKILVLSGNLNALAQWPAGVCTFAFTAAYTIPLDGGYIPCFVINGTWSVTQPSLANLTNSGATPNVQDGTNPPANLGLTAQADLPALGASLTLTAQSTRTHYMALY